MTIRSLPPGGKDVYKCVFGLHEVPVDYITGAASDTITCTTPPRNLLPPIQSPNGKQQTQQS